MTTSDTANDENFVERTILPKTTTSRPASDEVFVKMHFWFSVQELVLGLRPPNERRRYKITPSLIGCAPWCTISQDLPCLYNGPELAGVIARHPQFPGSLVAPGIWKEIKIVVNKNTLESCKNPRPTSGWSELTKSCTTSTMNFHMAYFSWIPQNNAKFKLSCKFGESKCNPR